MSSAVCPECGARVASGAERCDLCGTPLAEEIVDARSGETFDDALSESADARPGTDDIPDPKTRDADLEKVFCNQCGWANPVGSKYCSRCGAELQQLTASGSVAQVRPASLRRSEAVQAGKTAPEKSTAGLETYAYDPTDDAGGAEPGLSRYVGAVIGVAVLIVVALYMITVVSKQNVSGTRPAADAVQAPAEVRSAAVIEEYESIPVGERFAPTVDSLKTAIQAADGSEVSELRRELVDFLIGIGRIDRAAIEQQRLAARTDSLADWRRAGDLLYDWMETVNDNRKTDVALLAIAAYERVLEQAPDDLDARADLGWVYQYDPQNPMEAIRQTNIVLESDPNHLAANYNRGVFLLRINRISDALDQLERVKELSGSDSPYYRQADALIASVRRQQEAQRGS